MDISFRKYSDIKNVLREHKEDQKTYRIRFYINVVDNGDGLTFDSRELEIKPDRNPHLITTIKGVIIDALKHAHPGYNFTSQGDGVFKAEGLHGMIGAVGHLDSMDEVIEAYSEIIKRGFPRHLSVTDKATHWFVDLTAYLFYYEIKLN